MKTIPPFAIEPRFVIPDVLHMSIRVRNCLIDGLLVKAGDRDNNDRVINMSVKSIHANVILIAINSCGIKFEMLSSLSSKVSTLESFVMEQRSAGPQQQDQSESCRPGHDGATCEN
ncbi:hypothetical protein HPB50_020091 [Hyalomma asiaticum]|uniref:Uncharacterized protein n=1 Tax=Hyalomma asiaticum TaxID=266040 RepID=A0ACB7RNE7_HYAAI|nr:hypothetical protein HPB50_020091 [Hyalomma asiaticum]